MKQMDVLIIGAGAVGNAIAREISKKNGVAVGVLEKEPDTAFGISGRNSGVLHAGFNNKPGSLMAKLCVMGSEGFEKEAEEMKLSFKKTGKLVVARQEENLEQLQKLMEQGHANGVRELRILDKEELVKLAGYEAGIAALWSGMTGIFDPFQYTITLAEAAAKQGTEYFFGRQVVEIVPQGESQAAPANSSGGSSFRVTAQNLSTGEKEIFEADVLINSAGLFADEISRMAGISDYGIFPCRGEYHILDKKYSKMLEIPIYPIPNERDGGLGVHLTPTIHGNIMLGPSAEYLETGQEREDYSTTLGVMDKLKEEGIDLLPELNQKDCIRSFSGIRPKLVSEKEGGYADFVIEESPQIPGFIQLIGIESPGLTASIPIGKMVAQIANDIMAAGTEKERIEEGGTDPCSGQTAFLDPGDEKMLCRCEGITEKAILEAYDRILKMGAIPTVRGLKNRTRVTMGSCQGSFCTINIIELLQKKRNMDPSTLLWNGFGSEMFEGSVKG